MVTSVRSISKSARSEYMYIYFIITIVITILSVIHVLLLPYTLHMYIYIYTYIHRFLKAEGRMHIDYSTLRWKNASVAVMERAQSKRSGHHFWLVSWEWSHGRMLLHVGIYVYIEQNIWMYIDFQSCILYNLIIYYDMYIYIYNYIYMYR